MRFVYPNGLRKALTFSYDDGQSFDRRLAELLRSHGMKGTFHLNSERVGADWGNEKFITAEELKEVYAGHEIACHGVQHRNPTTITRQQMVLEIQEDRKALEKLTGHLVQGMSYAFGNYNEEIIEIAKSLGIKYSRTVKDTKGFFPPADFMQWHPTCHHDNHLLELGDRFLDVPGYYELPVMYVWGHSILNLDVPGTGVLLKPLWRKWQGKRISGTLPIWRFIHTFRQCGHRNFLRMD